jgi:hypothetical protein
MMEDDMALGWFLLGLFLGTSFGIFAFSLLQMGSKRTLIYREDLEAHRTPGSMMNTPAPDVGNAQSSEAARLDGECLAPCEQGA